MNLLKSQHKAFYNTCFFALAIALTSDLFIKGLPEKIFYIVSYVSIIFTVTHVWNNRSQLVDNRPLLWFMISLFLMAAARMIWGICFKHTTYQDIHDNYVTGGKRFLLAAFIIFYFYKARNSLNKTVLTAAIVVILAGLAYTLLLALQAHSLADPRIKLTADAATTASYLTVFVSLTCLYLSFQRFKSTPFSILLFFVILAINITLVILTETRSSVIVAPLMYVLFFFMNYRKINKAILYSCLAIFIAVIIGTPYAIWDRMKDIKSDIDNYHVNNDTSIGARFSIWKSGWHSVNFGIVGQNSDARTEKARSYIVKYEKDNPEAWKNVAYHLHNDMLEVLSIHGILGIIALVAFYLAGIVFSLSKAMRRENGVLFIILPAFLFGLADTVLIQGNTVLLICACLAMMVTAWRGDPK
ncbi:O-antigen ligase [Pantoea sp. BAV 3049]|uniref:O-antigen ligase family protein n=1 Tax=Pantoea sp. BAV 3049 TaxID=2654188 RepID=UPI00131E783F|nr:O-antigen ligase family protein [Pantoea sp. BAV 3049]